MKIQSCNQNFYILYPVSIKQPQAPIHIKITRTTQFSFHFERIINKTQTTQF